MWQDVMQHDDGNEGFRGSKRECKEWLWVDKDLMMISIMRFCCDVESEKEPCTRMSATQQAGLTSREANHRTHVGFHSSPFPLCHARTPPFSTITMPTFFTLPIIHIHIFYYYLPSNYTYYYISYLYSDTHSDFSVFFCSFIT